ncbi:MAG: GNAT family N-acetyltransferase [Anaerolineae bacterium]
MTLTIRTALPEEAAELVALLLRSKAVWGYDAAFMGETQRQAQRAITPETITTHPTFAAEIDRALAGFVCLCPWASDPEGIEIDWLFVDPAYIGRGVGRALVGHAAAAARQLGACRLWVVSDQNAEGFYRAMGMTRVGEEESSVQSGRMNPVLCCDLAGQTAGPTA